MTICVNFLLIVFALLRIFALIWHFSCFVKVEKFRVGHGHGLAQVYVAGFCIHPQLGCLEDPAEPEVIPHDKLF